MKNLDVAGATIGLEHETTTTREQRAEQTGDTFCFEEFEMVLKLSGCCDRGVWFQPVVPEEMQITLFTKDGKEWNAQWTEAKPVSSPTQSP